MINSIKNILKDSKTVYKPYYLFKVIWTIISLPALLYHEWCHIAMLKLCRVNIIGYHHDTIKLFQYNKEAKNIVWFESVIEHDENISDNVIALTSLAPLFGFIALILLCAIFQYPALVIYTFAFTNYFLPSDSDYSKFVDIQIKHLKRS